MSFSLLNKLKHKRLEKMLREKHQSDHDSDLDQLVDNSENQHDIKKLLMAYLELEKIVKSQNKTISDLTNRVTFLESKMSTHSDNIILEESVSGPSSVKDVSETWQREQNKLNLALEVEAEVHRDINGVLQKPKQRPAEEISLRRLKVTSERATSPEIEILNEEDSSGVFRHSNKERKNILKKPRVLPRLKAVSQTDRKKKTFLVYVGRAEPGTSIEVIHSYLVEIGIAKDDIADILKLNSRNGHYDSFCVSLNSAMAEKIALETNNWPYGITIRKFHRSVNVPTNSSEKYSKFGHTKQFYTSTHDRYQTI